MGDRNRYVLGCLRIGLENIQLTVVKAVNIRTLRYEAERRT